MKPDTVCPDRYEALLQQKADAVCRIFSGLELPEIEIFPSERLHYRMRAEFRIWREGSGMHYAMFDPVTRAPFFLEDFPVGSLRINDLMPRLMETVRQNAVLSSRLFQVEFLTATTGDALITMIYHRALDQNWSMAAKRLEETLGVHVMGRSKKQRLVVSRDFITERFTVGERTLSYRQYENGFTQPNAGVNAKMLAWAERVTCPKSQDKGDLVELYCGNGNFTCVLAPNFSRVLANEISRMSVKAALYNLECNGSDNVDIFRMSSSELSAALNRERSFRRLAEIDLDQYRFHTVFVDPPRAGLDPATLEQVRQFDNIVYVSCNPETLYRDMKALDSGHRAEHFALFDQFPYTSHMECGVYMTRR